MPKILFNKCREKIHNVCTSVGNFKKYYRELTIVLKRLSCVHMITACECNIKISRCRSKRLLRKMQKIFGGGELLFLFFILFFFLVTPVRRDVNEAVSTRGQGHMNKAKAEAKPKNITQKACTRWK